MNLFRTFLIVLLTSLMAIAKTGYAAASDVPSTTHAKENVLSQNDLGHVASFEKGHQLLLMTFFKRVLNGGKNNVKELTQLSILRGM